MKSIILFLLLPVAYAGQGQSMSESELALHLFKEGVVAFHNNEIEMADSLFRKSCKIKMNEGAVFNAALTRFILHDTCLACYYLGIARNDYMDSEASILYSKNCLTRADTIYYNRYLEPVNIYGKIKYYEVIEKKKGSSVVRGYLHKKNLKKSVEISLNTLKIQESDVCASYEIINGIKYYDNIYGFKYDYKYKERIDSFDENLKDLLSLIYDFDSIPYNERYYVVRLLIDDKGKATFDYIVQSPFDAFDIEVRHEIEADIKNEFKNFPKLEPAYFNNKKVYFSASFTLGL